MRKSKEPHAVHLATATRSGRPSGRVVLLRGYGPAGFEFYTNYRSRKGSEIRSNPHAALTCYWYELGCQVRVEGKLKKVSAAASDRYFASRPRDSKLGAWASRQSTVIGGRAGLERRFEWYRERFRGKKVPRPAWWGGYVLMPVTIEFWQSRAGRLHDRLLYEKAKGKWRIVRLSP
jgi:pyridoxamine 5'-phosphate oxidase